MSGLFTTDWLRNYHARAKASQAASEGARPHGEGVEVEGHLHQQIIQECVRRTWWYVRSPMNKPTDVLPGLCDFIIYGESTHVTKDGEVFQREPGDLLSQWTSNGFEAVPRMFHVECKSETGKLSDNQRIFITWCAKLGHKVHVVTNFAEFFGGHQVIPVVTISLASYEKLMRQVESAEARVKAAEEGRPFFYVMGPVRMADLKKLYCKRVLDYCKGNATLAADTIDVNRQTITKAKP